MRAIALVATDMDGTLLDGEGRVPAGFEEWVLAHPAVRTVIASGRQVYTLMAQFERIADRLTFMADNGAVVMERGQMLYQDTMESDVVRAILQVAGQLPGAVVVLCGLEAAYIERSAQEVSRRSIEQYYARRVYLDDLSEALEGDKFVKVALFFECDSAVQAFAEMGELPPGLKAVVSSAHWIDIANASVNKGAAIKGLQKRLGIAPEDCMAFGDYLNDLELLQACGESYAMANGVAEIKAAARHVAPANTEGGVMQILSGVLS